MQPNYADLRFYNTSCNNGGALLPYEIENYTSSNATIWIGTNLKGANTTISVYYKNSTPVSPGQNVTGVWNSNFMGVWHMTNNTAVNILDSTYKNNGTSVNVTNATGVIDGGAYFNGSAYVDAGRSASLNNTLANNQLTLEGWFYLNGSYTGGTTERLIYRNTSTALGGFVLGMLNGTTSNASFGSMAVLGVYNTSGSVNYFDSNINLSGNTWYYVVATYAGGASGKMYINSVDRTVVNASGIVQIFQPASDLFLGTRSDKAAGTFFKGIMDEVRISNTSRSASWINQSYQMGLNDSKWVKLGTPQSKPS